MKLWIGEVLVSGLAGLSVGGLIGAAWNDFYYNLGRRDERAEQLEGGSEVLKGTIYVLREVAALEYQFAVHVCLDAAGDLDARAGEDVPEKAWSGRYGYSEPVFTGGFLFREGDEVELTDEETDEALAEIKALEELWEKERARLKEIYRR